MKTYLKSFRHHWKFTLWVMFLYGSLMAIAFGTADVRTVTIAIGTYMVLILASFIFTYAYERTSREH